MIEKTYNVGIYCRLSNDDERDAVKQEVIHPDYIIPRLTAHVKDVDGDCYAGIAIRTSEDIHDCSTTSRRNAARNRSSPPGCSLM